MGCPEVPPPLAHQSGEADGEAGRGGEAGAGAGGEAGGGGTSGSGGASGGGSGGASGGGNGGAPMRVCDPNETGDCAAVERVYAGGSHTCATLSDGTVRCWGHNDSGQLGDPEAPLSLSAGPVVVANLERPDSMALGNRHSCALKSGDLFCWGRNNLGQLGTGDFDFGQEPRYVSGGVEAVAAGFNNTCTILSDSTVSCWGIVLDGQDWTTPDLGLGVSEPTPVPALSGVSKLAVQTMVACALDDARTTVRCWGDGRDGKLGVGTEDDSATPVDVSTANLPPPVLDLCAASSHACALSGNPARVRCWGAPTYIASATPATISLPFAEEIVDLECGFTSDCALLKDGTVACWGCRHLGLAGSPSSECSTDPEYIVGISNAVQLAYRYQHACALLGSGEVRCWGENLFGELGAGFTSDLESTPQSVVWQ